MTNNLIIREHHAFLLVTEKAKEIFASNLFELFIIYSDGSEASVSTFEELDTAICNGFDIAIYGGFLPQVQSPEK